MIKTAEIANSTITITEIKSNTKRKEITTVKINNTVKNFTISNQKYRRSLITDTRTMKRVDMLMSLSMKKSTPNRTFNKNLNYKHLKNSSLLVFLKELRKKTTKNQ
jgi:hypothetical protein